MHQIKKGNLMHFGMKVHTGVDADSGLVHRVATIKDNAHDITQTHALLRWEEIYDFADSGYLGVDKHEVVQSRYHNVNSYIATIPGMRKSIDKSTPMGAFLEKLELTKASIRAKVHNSFRVIKRQFRYVKVKYWRLAKNTANLMTLSSLNNLWMVRKRPMHMGSQT